MIERTFSINIECNSAAFDDDWRAEAARILRQLAESLDADRAAVSDESMVERFNCYLFDINGNLCGDAEMFTETYSR